MSKINRRKILKGGALALPVAWSAPVIETVILPAHAQTSCQTEGFPEFSVTCTSSEMRQVICTTIESPDGCLQTNCVPVDSLTSLEPNQMAFLEGINDEQVYLHVDDSNDLALRRYWNCDTMTMDDSMSTDEPVHVTVAGTNYTLVYEFGVNNATSTIFIRNIALVPA